MQKAGDAPQMRSAPASPPRVSSWEPEALSATSDQSTNAASAGHTPLDDRTPSPGLLLAAAPVVKVARPCLHSLPFLIIK